MTNRQFWRWFLFTLVAVCFLFSGPLAALADTDVSDQVQIEKTRLRYDRRAGVSYLDVAVANVSSGALLAPVKVVIDSISDPSVTVKNPDGMADGKPFFEYIGLAPGETSPYRKWEFDNSLRRRFTYTTIVYDATPAVVVITGKAVAGLPVVGTINLRDSSNPAQTSFSAINSDGSYVLNIDETWQSPILMWAEGWVNNQHLRLLSSFELEPGAPTWNVNTTPATTVILESAMGAGADEIDPLTVPIPPQGTVDQIQAQVEETLEDLFDVIGVPPNFNLFNDVIGDVGSPADQMFDALDFSTGENNVIIVADAGDDDQQVAIDPAGPVGDVPQDMLDSVGDTNDAITQIRQVLADFYAMYQGTRPDRTTLENELVPNLAVGFLNHGYGLDDFITNLVDNENSGPVDETFVGCSILRAMKTQYYGIQPVEENHDNHPEGVWVNVTDIQNGITFTGITAFVRTADGSWKWYGNRRPMRRTNWGRPQARQILYPFGSTYYQTGLSFWHNDVGNLALDRGINSLAIFNPAFAPETIDGVPTNCVKLDRREYGLSTKFRLTNVPRFWSNDYLYRVGVPRGLDLDVLKSQQSKEFVAIGLNTGGVPVRAWLYTIAETPDELGDLMTSPESYFAEIPRDTISFTPFDPADPDNPDAFPGQSGYFNWLMPPNPDLFPSFSILGWNDAQGNWNEFEIDNPAWYDPGDFQAWTSDTYLPGATATNVRDAEFDIWIRNANAKHYRTQKRYSRHADFIGIESGELVFDVDHSYSPDNLSDRIQARTRIRDTRTQRLETTIVVESAATTGTNAFAEVDVKIGYQPQAHHGNGDTDYIGVFARIRYENNQLFVTGFVWGSNNADGTDWYNVPVSGGNFPFGQPLNFDQPYTLAVEYFEATNQLVVEVDDGQGLGPYQSTFDMDAYPVFDPDNFQNAEIRTRIRGVNQAGDGAGMRVRCDNVYVNDVLYDDFNDGFGVNQWQVFANQ